MAFRNLLVACCLAVLVVDKTNASFLSALGLSEEKIEEFMPMVLRLPKLLPVLSGKVKSKECKDQVLKISEEAGEIPESEMTTDDVLRLICKLETRCFNEYIEAAKPLFELDMVKTLTKGADLSNVLSLAGTMFELGCKAKMKDEL